MNYNRPGFMNENLSQRNASFMMKLASRYQPD